MKNNNLNYLDDKYGHMNAENLLSLKNELESLELKEIYREIELHNYPIDNYKSLNKEALITEAQMGEHCTMFHNVTIPVDCELGYHEHHGNTEAYYMLTGKGLYTDDDKQYEIEAGDVVFCEEGHGHGLKNTGDVDISFVALVLKK